MNIIGKLEESITKSKKGIQIMGNNENRQRYLTNNQITFYFN